jgi:chromosome segregation ATPase
MNITLQYVTFYNSRHLRQDEMAINQEQVFQAAEQLIEQGTEPTNRNIRELLGGGSLATITPLLREWKLLQEQSADIPNSVRLAMDHTLKRVWIEAKDHAKRTFVGDRMLLEARISKLEDELRLADEAKEKTDADIAELKEKIKASEAAAEIAKSQSAERIADLKSALSETKEEAKEARTSERDLNKQLVALTKEASELRVLADKAQADADHANAKLRSGTK